MFKELFDFSYIFPSAKHRQWLFVFMLTMLVYSLNIIPEDIPLGIALLFCMFSPIKLVFFYFTFYSLFESVATFSSGLTVNVVLQLVIFLRVILFFKNNPDILKTRMAGLKMNYSAYWLLYAIMALIVWGNVTGLALFFRIVISIMVIWFVQTRKNSYNYWKAIFHILVFSVLCSVIYGFFNDTSLEREIEGLAGGSASQLFGSLGTTRLGMFLVIALNYPLYFVQQKKLKIGLIILLTILTFMTVSMTAVAVLILALGIYLVSLKQVKKILLMPFFILPLLVGTYSWWSTLSFVQPVVMRINVILYQSSTGDTDMATSGREHVQELYIRDFNNRNFVEKTIGIFNPDNFDLKKGKLSHNTYIDIMAYNGILGIILLLLYCYKTVFFYRKTELFYPILSMKLVLLVAAYTVSIYTSVYWTWFLFM